MSALLQEAEVETIIETMEYFEFNKSQLVVEQGKMGTTFFVTHKGSLEVSVNGNVCNTVTQGKAFGGLALLYNCPRTASVKAIDDCGVWGANGATFHKVLQENAQKFYAENRAFLDSIRLFDGMTPKQKDRVGEAFRTEVFEVNNRVVTAGEAETAIYFVKKGELSVCKGGQVAADGSFAGGQEQSRLGPGDCFGERALVTEELFDVTVVATGRCELLCISVKELREVLGPDLKACLERNFVLQGLKKSPIISQFSSSQQHEIVKAVTVKLYDDGAKIEDGIRFLIVVEGKVVGKNKEGATTTMERGQWWEDAVSVDNDSAKTEVKKRQQGWLDRSQSSESWRRQAWHHVQKWASNSPQGAGIGCNWQRRGGL